MHFHKYVDQNSPKLNSPKIEDLSIQGLKWRYGDPLDTRSHSHVDRCGPLVQGQPYVWIDDPLNTRSISPVKIRDPLDTRSWSHIFLKRPSRYKVSSEDTMILSIQDPNLMLLGAAHCSQSTLCLERWSSQYKISISSEDL